MEAARASIFIVLIGGTALLMGCGQDHKPNVIEHPQFAVVWMMSRGSTPHQLLAGYGFFLSEDGLIATSLHCLPDEGDIVVELIDGQTLHADFVEADRQADVALIQVHGNKYPFFRIGSDDIQPGMHFRIVTASNVVHGVFEQWANFGADAEVSANVSPFDCGAPVLADDGSVVGLVRMQFQQKPGCLVTPIWHITRLMPRLGAQH